MTSKQRKPKSTIDWLISDFMPTADDPNNLDCYVDWTHIHIYFQVRVPRVNSQGKVKTFKCKQCEFVAVTKLEFWKHGRGKRREAAL